MPRTHDRRLVAALGARVKAVRDARTMTQAELAEAVGLQPESISRLETGQVGLSLGNLGSIARALGVSLAVLLDDQPVSAVTADEAAMLDLWRGLDPERQRLAMRLLAAVARD